MVYISFYVILYLGFKVSKYKLMAYTAYQISVGYTHALSAKILKREILGS